MCEKNIESKLVRALRQVMEDECEMYRIKAEQSEHVFSERFEKKMQKLIRRTKKPYYPLVNTGFKRVACVMMCAVVGVLTVSIQTVDSNRDGYGNFAVNFTDELDDIRTIGTGDYPETLEERYEVTYDLSEYEIVGIFDEDTLYDVGYKNKNGDLIWFSQSTDSRVEDGGVIDIKDNKVYPIKINDYDGIYFLNGMAIDRDIHEIFWHNDRYVLSVSTNISKGEAIKIAESVREIKD